MGETIMILKARKLEGKGTPSKFLGERDRGDSVVLEVGGRDQCSNAFVGAGLVGRTVGEKRFIGRRREILEGEPIIWKKTGVLKAKDEILLGQGADVIALGLVAR